MWAVSICLTLLLLRQSFGESESDARKWSDHEIRNTTKTERDAKGRSPSEVSFQIDAVRSEENVSRFWTSTGFCGPDPHQNVCDWLLMPSMIQNIALIGAIPFGGIRQVRVHWLLDAIRVSGIVNGSPVYNFTCLDAFLGVLWSNGLAPGFEVMGNPSNFFTDFEADTQIAQWADLIVQLAGRYIDQFGLGYVSKWNFESWNEPTKRHFDGLNVTLKGFLNYYDATSTGLLKASTRLQFGGPGGACPELFDLESYCWTLLDHIQNGISRFSGRKDLKLNFISIHKKGTSPSNTKVLLDREAQFVNELQRHLPLLAANASIFNNEADPLVGWNVSRDWQADVTYAAMIAKNVIEHQNQQSSWRRAGIDFRLLSNDNGFLSYAPFPFTQRTQLARFQVNTTHPPHTQFVRKPAYFVMGLMALLGEQRLDVIKQPDYKCPDVAEPCQLGLLATAHQPEPGNLHDSWQMTVLLYRSNDTGTSSDEMTHVSLLLHNLPNSSSLELMFVVYYMDNNSTNPYKAWMMSGSPQTPDWKTFKLMRSYEEPLRVMGPQPWTLTGDEPLRIGMSDPSVSLLHLCARAAKPPDQVTNVVVYNVTWSQVQIIWSDSCVGTRCVKTYEVEHAPSSEKDSFVRINDRDTIFNSYFFAPVAGSESFRSEATQGFYRVRAVDYWGRLGEYSLIVQYPSHSTT